MSVASRELRPIQIQPLFATRNQSSASASRAPPAISTRRGVKRKLFDSENGDDINLLLSKECEKNIAHLLHRYNFDAKDIDAQEAKAESRVPVQKETIPLPYLIGYELRDHQKRLEEESPNFSKLKSAEITPPQEDHIRCGKCNVTAKSSIEHCETCPGQTLIKECANKSLQFTELRPEVSQSPKLMQDSITSSFAKFPSPSRICDLTETPK